MLQAFCAPAIESVKLNFLIAYIVVFLSTSHYLNLLYTMHVVLRKHFFIVFLQILNRSLENF